MGSLWGTQASCGELNKVRAAAAQVIDCDSKWVTCSILIPLFLPLFPSFSHCGCRAAAETVFEDDVRDIARSKLLTVEILRSYLTFGMTA